MRRKRIFLPGGYYHIYNRSIDRQTVLFTAKDFTKFISRCLIYRDKYKVKILAFCFLPNHFHFLIEIEDPSPQVSRFLASLCNSYAKYFNLHHERTGHVWQGRFKCKQVTYDDYLARVTEYIELNPIKHKIVEKIEDWPYTSYHGNYFNN